MTYKKTHKINLIKSKSKCKSKSKFNKKFRKKTSKKKLNKKKIKTKTLKKIYKMRGGNVYFKLINSSDYHVNAYINLDDKTQFSKLVNNDEKKAKLIEVDDNPETKMVRIEYGPFIVANKHIKYDKYGQNTYLSNYDRDYNNVRIYDQRDSKYIDGINNNLHINNIINETPIKVIDKQPSSNPDDLIKIVLKVWVDINNIGDNIVKKSQSPSPLSPSTMAPSPLSPSTMAPSPLSPSTMALPPLINETPAQPLVWLSIANEKIVNERHPLIKEYLNREGKRLPQWVPQRIIAQELAPDNPFAAINEAIITTGNKPYLWATEFENVHTTWNYKEPKLIIDGINTGMVGEKYFHNQKPIPFDKIVWDGDKKTGSVGMRDIIMEKICRAKLAADPYIKDLLCSTIGYKLLSIKEDSYWGFDPRQNKHGRIIGGKNKLAKIWMKLRDEICNQSTISNSSLSNIYEHNIIQTNIDNLFECYKVDKTDFRPPAWSKHSKIVMDLGRKCNVYYNRQDNIKDIEKLVREREPVNIAMKRYYERYDLKNYFGYDKGYYEKIPTSNSCPPWNPNILVYTPTYLDINQDNNPDYNKIYHILNVIGLAFDHEDQEDYKILMSYQNERIKICKKFYMLLFQNIYNVAMKLNMENIVMCYVGCGAFSTMYPGNILEEIWLPAFMEIFNQNVSKKLKIYTMGGESMGNPLTNLHNIEDIGLFPKCVNHIDNKKTLFINAWDCWSVPGNGNGGDNSLDGFVGRVTNIGVLGTSLTNPFLNNPKHYISL